MLDGLSIHQRACGKAFVDAETVELFWDELKQALASLVPNRLNTRYYDLSAVAALVAHLDTNRAAWVPLSHRACKLVDQAVPVGDYHHTVFEAELIRQRCHDRTLAEPGRVPHDLPVYLVPQLAPDLVDCFCLEVSERHRTASITSA
jgi:hypothetical protein